MGQSIYEQTAPRWLPANLAAIQTRFERAEPEAVLRWGLNSFGGDIVLGTGFGPSGIVLLHLATRLRRDLTVFYLQTDLLFPETLALRDELAGRLGIHFQEVHCGLSLAGQAAAFGPELWRHDPDRCCQLRKVAPLQRYLADKKAWITGIRRDQGPSRADTPLISWDARQNVVKLAPLAGWTQADVWRYLEERDLPYNPLHDAGYPSLGCQPCTSAVVAGSDERAGRWAGLAKTECGIHFGADGRLIRLNQTLRV